jgi:hypothetical protein
MSMEAIALKKEVRKEVRGPGSISPLDFHCLAPLKFFEHCANCPEFSSDCSYLKMALALLHGEKKLRYTGPMGKVRE